MKVTVTICNLCPPEEAVPASTWTIIGPEGRTTEDLCERHSEPLRAIQEGVVRRGAPKASRGTGRRRARVVTSIDEIEAKKKAAKKK